MNSLKEFEQFITKGKEISNPGTDVWLYTRVSSKDQFANQSLASQRNAGTDYSLKNGYHLTSVFGETYESARGDFTRKEFKSLISSVKQSRKRPFAILIYKMSRFSRTGGQAIALATELIEVLGVHLIEVSSGKNTLTERGKLEVYERLLKAREENIERLEMTIPGMTSFLKNGNWLGQVPKGYDHYGPRVKDVARIRGQQMIVVNEEGKILKKAWKMKANGVRDVDILLFLREKGIKINKNQLSKMWRRPFYCGVIVHNMLDNKPVKGNHEPLVSQRDFLEINRRLKEITHHYVSHKKDEHLPLNGFVRSFECGSSYSGYCVKKKGLYYYKNNRTGSRENISAKKLHESFVSLLEEVSIGDVSPQLLALSVRDQIEELLDQDISDHKMVEKRIAEIEKQLKNLKRKYMVLDAIDKEDYEMFKSELEEERVKLLGKNQIGDFQFSNLDEIVEKAIHLSKKLPQVWIDGPYEVKRTLQSMVFPGGILYDFKNRVSRTIRTNTIFKLTHLSSNNYTIKTKETKLINEFCPSVVAGTRLELVTFGL